MHAGRLRQTCLADEVDDMLDDDGDENQDQANHSDGPCRCLLQGPASSTPSHALPFGVGGRGKYGEKNGASEIKREGRY